MQNDRHKGIGARSEDDFLPTPPKSDYYPLEHSNLPPLYVGECDHVLGFYVPTDDQLHKVSMSNYHEYINEHLDYNFYEEETYKCMDYVCVRCPTCGKRNPWIGIKRTVESIINPKADE